MIFCFIENVDSTFQFQFCICSSQHFDYQKIIFLLTMTTFSQRTQSQSGLSDARITHSDTFATMLYASHSCKKIVRQISGIVAMSTKATSIFAGRRQRAKGRHPPLERPSASTGEMSRCQLPNQLVKLKLKLKTEKPDAPTMTRRTKIHKTNGPIAIRLC